MAVGGAVEGADDWVTTYQGVDGEARAGAAAVEEITRWMRTCPGAHI